MTCIKIDEPLVVYITNKVILCIYGKNLTFPCQKQDFKVVYVSVI